MTLRELLLDALFPVDCLACARPLRGPAARDGPLCAPCRDAMPPPPPPLCPRCGVPLIPPDPAPEPRTCRACTHHPPAFTSARGGALYEPGAAAGPLVTAVHALKYQGERSVARSLAVLLTDRLPVPDDALIVPVPLHPTRLRERRFNQAALLAREVGRLSGRPTALRALVRRVATSPQTALAAPERRRNLADAFVVPQPRAIAGRRILLVDDVVTTGATADACARALLAAGAWRVDVHAAGRTPIGPRA